MKKDINVAENFYCCGALDYQVDSPFCPVKYNKQWREYGIQDLKSTSVSLMLFCPNCGTRLPISLRDEWFDILEKEYDLEDPRGDDKKKVPKEFLSDDWWKKRGLCEDVKKTANTTFLPDKPVRCLF